ncbi:Phenylalanyl-tRNA synthetase alpha chain [Mesomycoplasma hyorhinis SK76]|uniref:phenylalanine--tRNA ligase n=1 Tax=Mesomycoplasma hyorhinis SK76 TaxID=1118964 RepID=A0AAI8FE26_MESHY|nr:Phenylalanyl-tRNA synthetase alpha chain [Mesomycoplasma hyorhinis SK76]
MDYKKVLNKFVINNLEDLKLAKNAFFGKDSYLAKLQNQLKSVSNEEKKELGKQISQIRQEAETFFANQAKLLEEKKINEQIAKEWIDINLPTQSFASLHPLTLIETRIRQWFLANGYFEVKASEIENDEYNFERLNIPKNHPAREMQDSLYIDSNNLLRTHNTGVSARMLELNKNKAFSQFCIGKVYRNDEDDQTHSHQFSQLDFISVGNLSITDLIGTLKSFLTYVFETDLEFKFRPSFFPFTEPSLEVDIFYKNRWIEILGSGMIHPNVLKQAGYTNNFRAIAAGVGLERLAMIKHGIEDIRELYKNDLRFLKQFK